MRTAHGPIVQFPIPRKPAYLVSDPDAVRQVLVTNARGYGKQTRQYATLSLITGDGLLTADNEVWLPQRRRLQPAFHRAAVELISVHISTAVARVCQDWLARCSSGSAVVDVDAAMMHLALEVTGHALFGADLSADAERLADSTMQALEVVIAKARRPFSLPGWAPTATNRALRSAVDELDRTVIAMLASRAACAPTAGAEPRDMLDLLLAADGMTARQVRDEIVTFIVAGYETVASALTWAWHLISREPAVLQRIQQEVDSLWPRKEEGKACLSHRDVGALPYTRAVLDETLRLFPPAWLLTRRSLGEDVVAGVRVPAGSLLIMSPWLLHRDPALWRDPDRFCPGRFYDGGGGARDAYLPFGAGPRGCIGREMALLEGVLVVAALAHRFDVIAIDDHPVQASAAVTVRPAGGLRLRVTPRA